MTTLGTFYYLAVGDTLSSNLPSSGDYLDLMESGNGQNGYLVMSWTFTESREVDPLAPKVKYTLADYAKIVMHIQVFGSTADQLQANIRAIDLKLRQARLAQGPQPQGTGVCFWQREQNMTQPVFWDVVDGQLGAVGYHGAALVRDYTLTLDVLPFAHGVPVVGTATGTITNGTASVLYVPAIQGDVPALGQLTLPDVSTSTVVINGWTIGARSQPAGSMLTTDYTPIQALTAASPGTATADGTAIGGTKARVTVSAAWQTVATVTQPAGAKQTGLFDTYVRLKDAAVVLGKPGTPTATGSGTGGNLRDGIYQYLLTTYDGSGNESPITPSVFTTVPITTPNTNYVMLNAESGDTGGWDAEVTTAANAAGQGNIEVTTQAALANTGSVYGYRAVASNGLGDVLYKASPGGGNTVAIRMLMRINTDTGPASASIYNQIPLVYGTPNPVLSLYNAGSGWNLGVSPSVFQNGSAWPLSENTRLRLEVVAVWNGSNVYTVSIYLKDTLASTGTVSSSTAPTNLCIGARSTAGTTLSADFDEVQIANARIGSSGGNAGSASIAWSAGTNVTGYYLYFSRNGGSWYRIDVGNVVSYSHTSATAGVQKDPPSATPAVVPSSFKLQLAANTNSATPTYYDGPVVQAGLSNGNWEEIYAGALSYPPIATQDAKNPVPWIARIQTISGGTTFNTFDVDSIRVRPHRELPQISVQVPGLNLATRVWVLATNRYGFSSCQLQNTSGLAVEGSVTPVGGLYLGPGDTKIDLQPICAAGVSDVVNCKFTAQLTYTPRFRYQRGNT